MLTRFFFFYLIVILCIGITIFLNPAISLAAHANGMCAISTSPSLTYDSSLPYALLQSFAECQAITDQDYDHDYDNAGDVWYAYAEASGLYGETVSTAFLNSQASTYNGPYSSVNANDGEEGEARGYGMALGYVDIEEETEVTISVDATWDLEGENTGVLLWFALATGGPFFDENESPTMYIHQNIGDWVYGGLVIGTTNCGLIDVYFPCHYRYFAGTQSGAEHFELTVTLPENDFVDWTGHSCPEFDYFLAAGTIACAGGEKDPLDVLVQIFSDKGVVEEVPEPSTLVLLGMGAVTLLLYRRRRNAWKRFVKT